MPITPFHFGPGALIKAAAPNHFSWMIFALANVVIDLEPVSLFLLIGDPAHPWLHTLPGALAVAVAVAVFGRRPCEALLRFWNRRLSPRQARWLAVVPDISTTAAWVGALTGTLSHLALDAVMHADVEALWPIVHGNPWRGALSLDRLHLACILAGVAAAAWWSLRRWVVLRGRC